MCKKVIGLISLVLVLVLAGNSPAETFIWDNGGESELWNVPENWDPNGIPGSEDTARINIEDANCLIDDSVSAECATVIVASSKGTSYLNMTGGTLTTTTGYLSVGHNSNNTGVFTISDGIVTIGGANSNNDLYIGTSGTGTIIMNGGEINVYDKVEIGKDASGNGTLYIYDGTLTLAGNSTDLEIAKYGKK